MATGSMTTPSSAVKLEYKLILSMVEPNKSVLDLGCGDGTLMLLLAKEKGARVQGIELDEKAIYECVGKGLSVFHGDIDSGLPDYPDKSFDYVILNQSLQQVKNPDKVLSEALRVGREVIVGTPNFAYIKARFDLGIHGKAPITSSLPYEWYNTPNTHFLSISDFIDYCLKRGIRIKKQAFVTGNRQIRMMPNLFADIGIFLIYK